MTIVVTKKCHTQSFAKQLKFLFQVNPASNKKNQEKRDQAKKAKANQMKNLVGKLLKTNEELLKRKEEINGCKMKRTRDKVVYKKLKIAEHLRKQEEKLKKEILKLELKLKNKEERKSLKLIGKDVKNNKKLLDKEPTIKDEIGKKLKKNED